MHDLGAANVDAVDEDGFTALMLARENGHLDSVKYLHETKADLRICSGKAGKRHGHTDLLKVTLR